MIKKTITKLVGIKKDEFDSFIESGQIQVQPARLIPALKTGNEMALASIFLTTIKLVKEFRDGIFREIKLSRSGKVYYFTEACFPEIDKSRIDGLIIIVTKGIIIDAAFFEMKNKNNDLELQQIETYLSISKKLKVEKLVTISNEFVADSSHSPLKIKPPKNVSLFHFSWTYLTTKGRLLLFKNAANIKDEDQVEIMRETLYYFESPISGISGYTQMNSGWKELADCIRAQKQLKTNDEFIADAVLSWYEEEKSMALLMSRKLGVLVKSSSKDKDSLKDDINKAVKHNYLSGSLSIKNSVSDIKIIAEFERRMVSMSIRIIPPLNKGTVARITWIAKQLENCKKKDSEIFKSIESDIWVEADIKYVKAHIKVGMSEIDTLNELAKGKEIQAFNIIFSSGFGANFASNKKFIERIEKMILDYYEGVVQHMTNWSQPAPKLEQ